MLYLYTYNAFKHFLSLFYVLYNASVIVVWLYRFNVHILFWYGVLYTFDAHLWTWWHRSSECDAMWCLRSTDVYVAISKYSNRSKMRHVEKPFLFQYWVQFVVLWVFCMTSVHHGHIDHFSCRHQIDTQRKSNEISFSEVSGIRNFNFESRLPTDFFRRSRNPKKSGFSCLYSEY